MKVEVIYASMSYTKEDGYVGTLHLEVEGHKQAYEMALQSKKGNEWGYGLFFLSGSGNEEQLTELEDEIEDNDELFDRLIEVGKAALQST